MAQQGEWPPAEQTQAKLLAAGYEVIMDVRPFGRWRAVAFAPGRPSAVGYGQTAAEAVARAHDALRDFGELD